MSFLICNWPAQVGLLSVHLLAQSACLMFNLRLWLQLVVCMRSSYLVWFVVLGLLCRMWPALYWVCLVYICSALFISGLLGSCVAHSFPIGPALFMFLLGMGPTWSVLGPT